MVKYQQEFLSQIKGEMEPLVAKDWEEVGQDGIPLDVDFVESLQDKKVVWGRKGG
jgi:hypothetical protein